MSRARSGRAASAPSALSPRVLAELRGVGGEELVREVLASFLERTPERLRAATAAVGSGDLGAAARALHSLRSAAGAIGALSLAELAGRLERLAAEGAGSELAAEWEALRRRSEEALAEARRRTRGPAPG